MYVPVDGPVAETVLNFIKSWRSVMEGSSSTVLLTVSLIVSMPRDLQGGADEGWG